ncbi:sensor histidine kinase [Neolewinella maritima]|nr:sensor histidine kinase [Neolewinella maritima]
MRCILAPNPANHSPVSAPHPSDATSRQGSRLFRTLYIGLILLMTVVLASVVMEVATFDTRRKLDNALQLERDLGLLLSTLLDAETGQRGYLLTGQNDYLEPYHLALDTVAPILARIGGKVREDSIQQLRLQRVNALTADKFRELSQTLVLHTTEQRDSLYMLFDGKLDETLMDRIRHTIDLLRQEELEDIARRYRQVNRLSSITTVLRLIGVVGLALVFYYIYTQLRPLFAQKLRIIADRDHEIEERIRIERMNTDLIATLNLKNRELDQFAYTASHDLREPLRTVRNYVEILTEDHAEQLDDEGHAHLHLIHRTTDRMRVLIDSLLQYSRVGVGEQLVQVDLQRTLTEVLENLQFAIERSAAIVTVSALPRVPGYPIALRQLFQNLLTNALKFHPPGVPPQVTISAHCTSDRAVVYVQDNGIGMTKADQQRIFALFERLHPADIYEGQGIGLAFCQKIVQLHRGELTVTSKISQGSTFSVALPLADVHEETGPNTPD